MAVEISFAMKNSQLAVNAESKYETDAMTFGHIGVFVMFSSDF